MSKHTKGPWAASGPRIFSYQHDAEGLGKGVLAECYTQYSVADAVISDEEVEANARLMAAAPEFLGAAKRLLDYFDNPDQHPDCIKDDVLNHMREVVRSVERRHTRATAPELDAYRQYVEDNLERIERDGWTPVCFDEFRESEECANHMKEEA